MKSLVIGDNFPKVNVSIYNQIIKTQNITLSDEDFIRQYKDGETSFTRNRVFSFRVLLTFLMTTLQKAIQREIALFAEAIKSDGGSIPEVSKAAFCKARKKLKPEVFCALNEKVLETYYGETSGNVWLDKYRIVAVDGSTCELPNSVELLNEFGVFKTRDDGKKVCMARTLTVYDSLNHLTLYGKMDRMEASETTMLWEALPELKAYTNDVFVFDRYYASMLLFFYLDAMDCQYCFRMKENWWKIVEEFNGTDKSSAVIDICLPAKNLAEAKELGITKTKMKIRLAKIDLGNGKTEILLTSLTNEKEVSINDLKELYALRWEIEESYKVFKHKVCIENFTGKSVRAVLQDFYVKLYIMNLTAAIVNPINEALSKPLVKVKRKRIHKVNFTEAIFSMKKAVVSFFLFQKIDETIKHLAQRCAKITEPMRKNRKYHRHHLPKKKHHMCYKPI